MQLFPEAVKIMPTLRHSFIREDGSRREQEGDSTRQPDFPPATDRGFNFQPFKVERRDLKVNQRP
jgi:hypothetical protein